MIVEQREAYYSEKRINWFLLHWPEVCTLAESPSSSEGLLLRGPTPESPHLHHKGSHSNPMRWCDVKADVERARDQLVDKDQRKAIQARMDGVLLASIGIVLQVRNAEALAIYHGGVAKMSEILEGCEA